MTATPSDVGAARTSSQPRSDAIVETDYLVVGAGATGMAFTDSLVTSSSADVVVVDRRERPGGHWNDAYSFLRLHLPSAYYGVNSLALGSDQIDQQGQNVGQYERAGAAEICAYYERVLDESLLPTGQVRFLPTSDYLGEHDGRHSVRSRLTGETVEVRVRRKVVDATYLGGEVPATHTRQFEVAPGVRLVPVGGLPAVTEPGCRYVLIGGGKTAIDACLWLLDNGVAATDIQWIRPREAWLFDRASYQPLDLVSSLVEGLSFDLEALAGAASLTDLFEGLERRGRLVRIDDRVVPTMFHCASISQDELARMRAVTDVVRLGRVQRIEPDRILLEHGCVPTGPGRVHVDCSAIGLRRAAPRPVFEDRRITLQPVRTCSPCFNAALLGYVEATRDDVVEQNRLCPPNPYPDAAQDWLRCMAANQHATAVWAAEPDLKEWIERSRLNLVRGVAEHAHEPVVLAAFARAAEHRGQALRRLQGLLEQVAG